MKDKLIKLFKGIRNHMEFHSLLYSKDIDLSNYNSPYEIALDLYLDATFSVDGIELINWWLYEGDLEDKILYEPDGDSEKELDGSNPEVFVEYLLKNYKK